MRFLITLALALSLAACATQPLETVTLSDKDIRLVDNRSAERKAHHRASNFSAIVLLADDRFTPRALDIFQAALVTELKPQKPLVLEVEEFRVADFFPGRLGSGAGGVLMTSIMSGLMESNTDWKFIEDLQVPRYADSVLCIFVGKLDGVPIKVASYVPYKISPMAGLVYNDDGFRQALKSAIATTAARAVEKRKAAG